MFKESEYRIVRECDGGCNLNRGGGAAWRIMNHDYEELDTHGRLA